MHFCEFTARKYGRPPVPRNTSLNWFIPAFVNINVGSSCGTTLADGAKLRLGKSLLKNVVLNILPFGTFEGEIVWSDDEFVGIKFKEDHKAIVNLILEREVEDAP